MKEHIHLKISANDKQELTHKEGIGLKPERLYPLKTKRESFG